MSTETPDLTGYVLLTEAPNLQWAHLIAGRLQENDIAAHAEEDNLADEWAMSQKMMGTLGVRVLVPGDRLDEARAIFLAMSQPMPVLDEPDPELAAYAAAAGSRRRRLAWLLIFLVLVLPLIGVGIMWLIDRLG